eukprot:352952_1
MVLDFLFLFAGIAYSDLDATITIDFTNSNNLQPVPGIYWQSCGFTPASDILGANGTENMWWVGRIPRQGIHYVRIHYLIDLLNVTGMKTSTSLTYDWTKLDHAMHILRINDRYPIFELMGNPNNYWNDFMNKTQLYTWKDLVTQIATRYIEKYGTDHVTQWLFETWNEPPHWTENFSWNETSWQRYFDACNHGLLSVHKDLRFGAPSGGHIEYLYYALDHVTSGTDYFTGQTGDIRIDFVSQHHKGNEGEDIILTADLQTENLIVSNYSSLINRTVLFNDEGDPKVGWGNRYIWRATPSYAAFEVQGFNYHFENFNTILSTTNTSKRIPFALLSNDNCFMGDGSFQLRTVNARFVDITSGAFEFIPKSGLQIMSLLSLHGNQRMNQSGITITGTGEHFVEVLTFVNKSDELYEILVVTYSSNKSQNENNTQNTINIAVKVTNLKDITYYDSIIANWNLDFKNGNPYATWQSFNSPALPTMDQIERMRISSNPLLTMNKGGLTNDVVFNAPGVVMTHFVFAIGSGSKWNKPPPKVENVKIVMKDSAHSFVKNGDNVFYISWDTLDSHIIAMFIINYSASENGPYTQFFTDSILDGYVWITSNKNGYISVQAMDYFGLNGTMSDSVALPIT